MEKPNEGSWKSRWQQQWLEARMELLMLHGQAEALADQLDGLVSMIEVQTALVKLYAALAKDDEPP